MVSIIIVNYNTLQKTRDCIESIFNNTYDVEFEIIVIDNASTDGSKEYFVSDKRIRYVYSKENMGFGRANNVGMMLSKGEYIFLLNSDTILLNNAVKLFQDTANITKDLAFYGSWLLDCNKNYTFSGGDLPTMIKETLIILHSYLYKIHLFKPRELSAPKDQDVLEVGYITGADLFFKKDIYNKFGGFDSSFFLYYEETDWQARLKKEKIKSYIINGPRIIHLEGGSTNSNKKKNYAVELMKYKSRIHYLSRHSSGVLNKFYLCVYAMLFFPIYIFYKICSRQTNQRTDITS